MKRIRIYRNPGCAKCARYARTHEIFDWLGRIKVTTIDPPTGRLSPGEVLVERLATGEFLHGAAALEEISRQIPVYLPLRLLLKFAGVRRYADRELSGCGGDSCAVR
ncbi:MAG: hypothetical protein ACRETO_12695 [Gammaproteobacteria bacterium]